MTKSKNKTGFKGVRELGGRFQAQLTVNNKKQRKGLRQPIQ